jgi:hypothetical protein
MSTIIMEREKTLAAFNQVEELENIAQSVDQGSAQRLNNVVQELIDGLEPVRVSVAASLLELTKPTIESWTRRGLLTSVGNSSPLRLDPHRLHEVLHVIRLLRDEGAKPGTLLERVWHRLQDQELLERQDLQEGLAALKNGDVLDA